MTKSKTCKGCAYMLTICKDGKVIGWCCELSDVPTTEDSEACEEFLQDDRDSGKMTTAEAAKIIESYDPLERGYCYDGGKFPDFEEAVKISVDALRRGPCVWCAGIKKYKLRIEYYWIDEWGRPASLDPTLDPTCDHFVRREIARFCPNCGADMRESEE